MKYRLISFAAEPESGTYYTNAAKVLRKRCDQLGIHHHIELRDNAGSWVKNTRQKPTFIRECLTAFSEPLLWVDVDSLIHSKPDLSGYEDCDFAGGPIVGRQSRIKPPLLVMGIALFFNCTDGAKWLASKWEEICGRQQNEHYGDHRLLSNILHQEIPIKWRFLPEPYARSNSSMRSEPPVISLGLARPVESRRRAMDRLNKGIISGLVDGKI